MTTTELIQLLQRVEKGASGRSCEIRIYTQAPYGVLEKEIMAEEDKIEIISAGDGCAGAELSLAIKRNSKERPSLKKHKVMGAQAEAKIAKQNQIITELRTALSNLLDIHLEALDVEYGPDPDRENEPEIQQARKALEISATKQDDKE